MMSREIQQHITVVASIMFSFIFLVAAIDHEISRTFGLLIDDAYISLRYAKNLVEGYGLNFNETGRVEGYTNFLYVLLMSMAFIFKISPVAWIKVIGIVSSIGLIVLSLHLIKKKVNLLVALIIGLALSLDTRLAFFSLWGLEITFYPFLCLLSIYYLLSNKYVVASIVLALAAMTRIEASVVLGIPMLLFFFLQSIKEKKTKKNFIKDILASCLPFIFIFGSYFVIRWMYYGYLLPNTFYAKVNLAGSALPRGIAYITEQTKAVGISYVLIIGAIALVLSIIITASKQTTIKEWFSANYELFLFSIVAIFALFFIAFVGGDHFGARFIYHYFIIFILGSVFSIYSLENVVLGNSFWLTLVFSGYILVSISSASLNYGGFQGVQGWVALGKYLNDNTFKGDTLAIDAAGAVPFYSDMETIDMYGLNDTYIAHLEVDGFGTGMAGHEKISPSYILERQPSYIATWATESGTPHYIPFDLVKFRSWYFPYAVVMMDMRGYDGRVIEITDSRPFPDSFTNNSLAKINSSFYVLFKRYTYPHAVALEWKACELPTHIGTTKDCSYVSNNKDGALIFGPYIKLSAGLYETIIDYEYLQFSGSDPAILDIVSSKKKSGDTRFIEHYSTPIELKHGKSAITVDFEVKNENVDDDFEIRIFGNRNCNLQIFNMKIMQVIPENTDN